MKSKKIILLILMLVLTLTLSSCSVSSIIKRLTDGKVDIDDDGNVKIEDEDGKYQTGDKVKWDKDKMNGLAQPDFKVTTVMTTEDGTAYLFEEFEPDEYQELINELKSIGYTYNTYEMEDSMFVATNEEGYSFSITYDSDSKTGTITAVKGDPPDEDGQYEIGDQEWDSSKIGGLPDPGGEITAYVHDDANKESYYVLTGVIDHQDYVDTLIGLGYDDVMDELIDGENFMWQASNENGDVVYYLALGEAITIQHTAG